MALIFLKIKVNIKVSKKSFGANYVKINFYQNISNYL